MFHGSTGIRLFPPAVPPPTDPWAALDGRANAPTGAAAVTPFPTILNVYPSADPPNARVLWTPSNPNGQFQPPWHVAGVDYAVGPRFTPTNVVGVNALPSGTSLGTNRITVTGNNVTFSGWDFTQGANAPYAILWEGSNGLVTDCIFEGNGVNAALDLNLSGAEPFTCQYTLIDQNGQDSDANGSYFQFKGNGPIIAQYCWFHNSGGHNLFGAFSVQGTWIVQYCVISDSGNEPTAHPDYYEDGSGGSQPNFNFNLMYQRTTTVGSQGLSMNSGPYLNGNFNNNTCLASNDSAPLWPGGASGLMAYFCDIDPTLGTDTVFNILTNYIDPTLFGEGAFKSHPSSAFTNYSGNINMSTGAILPGN